MASNIPPITLWVRRSQLYPIYEELRAAGLYYKGSQKTPDLIGFEINERNATTKAITAIEQRKEYVQNYNEILPTIARLVEAHRAEQNIIEIQIDRTNGTVLFNTRYHNPRLTELMKILRQKYWFTEDREGIRYIPDQYAFSTPTRFFYHILKDIRGHFQVDYKWVVHTIDLRKAKEAFQQKYEPWEWQMEAHQAFKKNASRGVVEASSGSGKTIFGIYEILELSVRTAIIVPTEVLAEQWEYELSKVKIEAGLYYGREKNIKDITIFIINSAAKWLPQHPEYFSFILLDEVHHSAAYVFSQAHDHLAPFALGISATVEREDQRHEDHIYHTIGPRVYELSVPNAIQKGYLARLKVVNIKYQLAKDEWLAYVKIDPIIRKIMARYAAMAGDRYNPFMILQREAKAREPAALKCLKLIQERKAILEKSVAKIPILEATILQEPAQKWIIFCELIEQAEAIKEHLSNRFAVGVFHSKMNKNQRETALTRFEIGKTNIMVAVKALDEGYNVPECKRGIISGGSSTKRQIIQRVGRLLRELSRLGGTSKDAILYQLYAEGTKEEDYVRRRTRILQPERTEWLKWQNK